MVSVALAKLKNELLTLKSSAGLEGEIIEEDGVAVIVIEVIVPAGATIFKPLPVSVNSCERYGYDPETNDGK